MTRPHESIAVPSVPAKNDEPSAKSEAAIGGRKPETVPATSPPHAADTKPTVQKPQAISGPTGSLSSLTKPTKNPARSDGESAEPAQASIGAREAARSGRPGDGQASEHLAQMQDVYPQIQMFVSRYTSAYEAKDLAALLRFFEEDAVENGKPIEELIPVYRANFQRAEKLRYKISVGRWEVGKNEVMLDGSFNLFVKFWHEAPVESTGSIHLTLIRRSDGFGVKRLDYSFKEFRKNEDMDLLEGTRRTTSSR
jgi:hypothetical protein